MGKTDKDHISLQIPQHTVVVDANIGLGDVSVNHEIVEAIEVKVKKAFSSPSGRDCSIFRVHENFHKMNERAYSPLVVSIGPLHHGKPHLQEMESIKLMYMHDHLYRATMTKQCSDDQAILRGCAKFIESKEEEARNCYSEPINHIKSNEFIQMMLIDGLFLIELFYRYNALVNIDGYDPIFSKIGDFSSIYGDLLLVENQIPLFVLTGLLVAIGLNGGETESKLCINMLVVKFFNEVMPRDNNVLVNYSERGGKHILDVFANTFHPTFVRERVFTHWIKLPNATEMKRSGIKFKKGSTTDTFLNIKFNSKSGELEIPPILLQDTTEIFFRNVIASEQHSSGNITYMTSYAMFMNSLIESADDVRVLLSNDIVTRGGGNDEHVSKIFNKLCCELVLHAYNYSNLSQEIVTYCRTDKNIWKAILKRDYCTNPCTTVSVMGGITLLILTLIQTVTSIMSLHRSS